MGNLLSVNHASRPYPGGTIAESLGWIAGLHERTPPVMNVRVHRTTRVADPRLDPQAPSARRCPHELDSVSQLTKHRLERVLDSSRESDLAKQTVNRARKRSSRSCRKSVLPSGRRYAR